MPSEVVRIDATCVELDVEGHRSTIPNDVVFIQVGGTAPAALLQGFGIEVVTKRGES